ncbi:MAG: DUF3885 domain-containing protein [Verrucomicrobiota bacterium]
MDIISCLEPALFYKHASGLRFETGPPEIEALKPGRALNPPYFEEARRRAITLFESVFENEAAVILVLQQFSAGRKKIPLTHPLLALASEAGMTPIQFSKRRDVEARNLQRRKQHWNRATVTVRKADADWGKILELMLYSDFGAGWEGNCYLLNPRRTVAFHLYDDRGLDVVAVGKDELEPIYRRHRAWILGYDEPDISRMFGE